MNVGPGSERSWARWAGSRERSSIRTVGEAAASTTALAVPRQRITVAREPAAASIWLSLMFAQFVLLGLVCV